MSRKRRKSDETCDLETLYCERSARRLLEWSRNLLGTRFGIRTEVMSIALTKKTIDMTIAVTMKLNM